jgi:hypothetical protein
MKNGRAIVIHELPGMNDAPKVDPPKRKRRWFQFSLRTLMVLTLLLGFGMATWIVAI